jgi:hypothetical protein
MSNQPPPPGDQPYGNQPPGGGQPYGNQPPGGGQPYGNQPPGGYQQPPPGYQGGYQQEQPQGGAGLAIAALIFGILALLTGWTVIIGIPFILLGLILGFIASSRAKKGRARGRGMALTGIVLSLLGLVSAVLVGVLIGSIFDEAQSYAECVDQAGNDQAALEQCQQDFEEELTN